MDGLAGRGFEDRETHSAMTTAASDDLICRVRAYLAGLEPPVPADELTDEEVAGLVMASLVFMEGYGEVHYSLPERFRLPPRLPASPPINVEVDRENLTARVSADTHYARSLEWGTYHNYEEAQRENGPDHPGQPHRPDPERTYSPGTSPSTVLSRERAPRS
jgi:hypothetical protein